MIDDDALIIYTDGSMFGSPRRGGIGFRFLYNDDAGNEKTEDFCPMGYKGATNNQMELRACIEALQETATHSRLGQFSRIIVNTDSQYVRDNVPRAIFEWPKTKWRKKGEGAVLNAVLWKELIKEIKGLQPHRVDFEWVPGHPGDRHNKAAHKLAQQSAKGVLNEPLTVVNVARKSTEEQVQIGCVKMHGQRIAIQIISSEFLSVQKVWRYKYQVVSKGSKYFDLVDQICSLPRPDTALSRWHKYLISVNTNTANPTILKVLKEIDG